MDKDNVIAAKLFSNGLGKVYIQLYTKKEKIDDNAGEWMLTVEESEYRVCEISCSVCNFSVSMTLLLR